MFIELSWKSWQIVTLLLLLLPVAGALILWSKKHTYWPLLLTLVVAFLLTVPLQFYFYTLLRVEKVMLGSQLQELVGTTQQVNFYPASRDDFVVGVDVTNSYRGETFNPPWPSRDDLEISIDNNLSPKGEELYSYYNLTKISWSYLTTATFEEPWKPTQITYSFKTNPPSSVDSITLVVRRLQETEGELGYLLIHSFSLVIVYGALLILLLVLGGRRFWRKFQI